VTAVQDRRARRPAAVLAWLGLVVAVAAVLALLLGKPTQTLLEQRDRYGDTSDRLATIRTENDRLRTQVSALEQPVAVLTAAREQHQRVPPGVIAIVVQPEGPVTSLPARWPFTLVQGVLESRVNDGTTAPAGTPSTTAG
jgi:cell division protein FtsB